MVSIRIARICILSKLVAIFSRVGTRPQSRSRARSRFLTHFHKVFPQVRNLLLVVPNAVKIVLVAFPLTPGFILAWRAKYSPFAVWAIDASGTWSMPVFKIARIYLTLAVSRLRTRWFSRSLAVWRNLHFNWNAWCMRFDAFYYWLRLSIWKCGLSFIVQSLLQRWNILDIGICWLGSYSLLLLKIFELFSD